MAERELTPEELLCNAECASDNLRAARENMRKAKTPDAAMAFCKAFQEARDARKRLPKLRLI